MPRILSLLLLMGLLTATRCADQGDIRPEWLYHTWMHSYEEDTPDYRVYRTDDYDFPPSRGREGFTLTSEGDFVRYQIAPADGLDAFQGHYEIDGDVVRVTMDETGEESEFRVLGLTEHEMRVTARP